MKKAQVELDFVGGLGSLSTSEEIALTNYFSKKKAEKLKVQSIKRMEKNRQEIKK